MQSQEDMPIDPALRSKNRKTFLLMLAFFITPVLLGYLAYFGNWIDSGNTVNKGTLIMPPIAIESLDLHLENGELLARPTLSGKWWLLYQAPSECKAGCKNSLLQTRQVRLALGKNTDRVRRVFIIQPETIESSPETREYFASAQEDALILKPSEVMTSVNNPVKPGLIYIVDPIGNIMMSYPAYEDDEEAILKAKLILKDLNKLLKVSQIG